MRVRLSDKTESPGGKSAAELPYQSRSYIREIMISQKHLSEIVGKFVENWLLLGVARPQLIKNVVSLLFAE